MSRKIFKRKIVFPTFTVVLMLIFGLIGFIAYYGVHETVKSCTKTVTGIVESEHDGGATWERHDVAGKYLRSGKEGRHWITIHVNTDGIFKHTKLYAARGYGGEGDRLIIHYNPEDPDEYYIGDIDNLNGYSVALVMFVIAGIMFVLSVFLMFFLGDKVENEEETEEEKRAKEEEKEKKAADRRKRTQEKIDRKTKRYTKNYTNEHIRKQIQSNVFGSRLTLFILFFGIALCGSSFIRSYIDINKVHTIPFNDYSDNIDDKFYSIMIEEEPQEIYCPNSKTTYYDLKAGKDHILAVNVNKSKLDGMTGSVKLRGTLRRININRKENREIIKSYYQSIGYLEKLKDEEYIYYCLDCSKISLWEYLKGNHPLGLAFGITFLIVALVFSPDLLYTIRCFRPVCSGRKYEAGEIDRLANDMDTIWLKDIEVLVTPGALIGLNHGLTIVDYRDIYGIRVKVKDHSSKHRKWKTYCIIIETKEHREITLSESERQYGYRSIAQSLDKKFVEYKLIDV